MDPCIARMGFDIMNCPHCDKQIFGDIKRPDNAGLEWYWECSKEDLMIQIIRTELDFFNKVWEKAKGTEEQIDRLKQAIVHMKWVYPNIYEQRFGIIPDLTSKEVFLEILGDIFERAMEHAQQTIYDQYELENYKQKQKFILDQVDIIFKKRG